MFNQKQLVGSIVGGRADMQEMLDFAAVESIKPMVEVMPMARINEAFDRLASGKARYRIVLQCEPA